MGYKLLPGKRIQATTKLATYIPLNHNNHSLSMIIYCIQQKFSSIQNHAIISSLAPHFVRHTRSSQCLVSGLPPGLSFSPRHHGNITPLRNNVAVLLLEWQFWTTSSTCCTGCHPVAARPSGPTVVLASLRWTFAVEEIFEANTRWTMSHHLKHVSPYQTTKNHYQVASFHLDKNDWKDF